MKRATSILASMASAATLSLSSTTAVADLQVHWKLDESSGTTAADSSGNLIDGTWAGTAGTAGWTPGDGVDGGSVTFSGANADTFINDTFVAITNTPFTISTWIKTTSTANDGMVYLGNGATGNQYNVLRLQGSVARANIRNPAEIQGAGTTPVSDGEWHHVLGVYAGTAERHLYVDGVLEATSDVDTPDVTLTRFGIGGLTRNTPHNPVDLFEGQLDDVALWDRAFTAVDAAALNGLGVLGAGNAADLDPLVTTFDDQDTVSISGRDWAYTTGLVGLFGETGGSVAGLDAYIVLDDFGNGMQMSSAPGDPIVVSYTATPATIFLGESCTIEWEVVDSTSVEIDGGIGPVAASGSTTVSPTETTTYTMIASNASGTVTPQVTVNVIIEPVIASFTAEPAIVFAGEPVTLAWDVGNADMLEIDNGVGVVAGAMNDTVVFPTENTTYTLSASNDNGGAGAEAMASVTVFPTPPPRELLLHWPLDEGTGTTTADLAGANPGTFLEGGGAITWATGVMGGALTFPNANDVTVRAVGAAPFLVDGFPFSIAGWVKTVDSANDTFAVLGTNQNGQYHSLLVRSGNAQALSRSGGFFTQTGPAVNDDAWHFIVGVYSHPASLSLYVDGVFTGERTTEAGAFVEPDRFAIGALARTDASVVDAFNGSVDDTSFWRGILNADEIAALHGGATGLGLNASNIEALLTALAAEASVETAGLVWSPTTALAGAAGTTTGTLAAGNATIVLDSAGNGMMAEPASFRIVNITRTDTAVNIEFQSTNAPSYIIQFSEDGENWEEVDDSFPAAGATTTYVDTDAVRLAAPTGLYRVIAGSE